MHWEHENEPPKHPCFGLRFLNFNEIEPYPLPTPQCAPRPSVQWEWGGDSGPYQPHPAGGSQSHFPVRTQSWPLLAWLPRIRVPGI